MRTPNVAPLPTEVMGKGEQFQPAGKPAPRTMLDISKSSIEHRPRPNLPPVAPSWPGHDRDRRARDGHAVDAALVELQDLFFASCVDYPPDEQLQRRIRKHCHDIEVTLRPEQLRDWRSARDCLLARLGFRLLPH